jgi:hypothetical protein
MGDVRVVAKDLLGVVVPDDLGAVTERDTLASGLGAAGKPGP